MPDNDLIDHSRAPLRNSVPESLRAYMAELEKVREILLDDRARKLGRDPEADMTAYNRRQADVTIRIEVAPAASRGGGGHFRSSCRCHAS